MKKREEGEKMNEKKGEKKIKNYFYILSNLLSPLF